MAANAPALARPRANFFISDSFVRLRQAKYLLFGPTRYGWSVFRDVARLAGDHSVAADVAGVTHATSSEKIESEVSVPSRAVCATSSISNHAAPLPRAAEVRAHCDECSGTGNGYLAATFG